MKHYKTVSIPACTNEELVKTTCDMCHKKIDTQRFEVDEVKISHRTGQSYPEGGQGDEVSIDMCGECFTNKLTPFLKSEGVKIKSNRWDW